MQFPRAVFLVALTAAALMLSPGSRTAISSPAGAADRADAKTTDSSMVTEVRHHLVMLPYYSVFDNLQFKIKDGDEVVLSCEVTRPTLKSDAAWTVGRVAGVEKVVNDIQVLPLSPFDDRIRVATYRAIFANDQLYRYALRAVPPIHIIVKNGQVTLVGVVASQADKDVAGIVANGVPGVFKVTNDLAVEKRPGKP